MRDKAVVIPVRAVRRVFIGTLVLIAVLLVVVIARNPSFRLGLGALLSPSVQQQIDRNAYQAVFLVGGQVFFGKLEQQSDSYFLLSDVYYLSVPDQASQQSQLVKRGSELQGPREPMIIPARQVLFIENVRDDGEVVTAIGKLKTGELPKATPPRSTAAPTLSGPSPSPTPTR